MWGGELAPSHLVSNPSPLRTLMLFPISSALGHELPPSIFAYQSLGFRTWFCPIFMAHALHTISSRSHPRSSWCPKPCPAVSSVSEESWTHVKVECDASVS